MSALYLIVLFLAAPPGVEKPAVHQPAQPPTARELARQHALELYARSLLLERDTDLFQALKALEEARTLDPEAATIHAALTQLYIALDRPDEALKAGAKALELNPGDTQTAYLHARLLRNRKRQGEAADVLARALENVPARTPLDLKAQLALDLAVACEELDNPARAEKALRQALDLLRQREAILESGKVSESELLALTAETWERLALVCAVQKKDQAALDAFAQARKFDPERGPRLAFHLARLHEQHGRSEQALTAVEEYLQTQPIGIDAHEMKCRLLRALDRGREAIPFLEKAIDQDPFHPGLPVLLGREYVRFGRSGDAIELYKQTLRTHPTREIAEALVERIAATAGGGNELLTQLDRLLTAAVGRDLQPVDANAASQSRVLLAALRRNAGATTQVLEALSRRLRSGDIGSSTAYTLADLAAQADQLELAERLFRAALRSIQSQRNTEHDIYGGLLRVLRQRHKHQDIVEVCKDGLHRAEATNRVLFHTYLSRAQLALGRTREALQAADDAVNDSSDRHRLTSRRNRALVLAEAGKMNDAVAECQALLREYNQAGDVAEIRHALSSVWSIGRNPERAAEQLKRIVQADPTDATACNDLAYQYAEMNRHLVEAENLARKALELDGRQRIRGSSIAVGSDQPNGAFIDTLGWVLFRQGKYEAARQELHRASQLPDGKDSPVIWDHLGDALARLDDREAACQAYRKALRLYEAEGRTRAESVGAEIQKKLRLLQP